MSRNIEDGVLKNQAKVRKFEKRRAVVATLEYEVKYQ